MWVVGGDIKLVFLSPRTALPGSESEVFGETRDKSLTARIEGQTPDLLPF